MLCEFCSSIFYNIAKDMRTRQGFYVPLHLLLKVVLMAEANLFLFFHANSPWDSMISEAETTVLVPM